MANRLLQSVPIWQKHWLKKLTKQSVARCHHCAVRQISESSDGLSSNLLQLKIVKESSHAVCCWLINNSASRRFCQNMFEMCIIFFYLASYFSRLNDKFLELYWWRIIQLCTFPFTSEYLAKRVHSDSKIDNLDVPNTRGSVIFQNCLHVALKFTNFHCCFAFWDTVGYQQICSPFPTRMERIKRKTIRLAGNKTNQTIFTSGFK